MDIPSVDLILPHVEHDSVCLPLSINTVSRYWDIRIPEGELKKAEERYPDPSGRILIEGIELAERHGLRCVVLRSDIHGLKQSLDAGIPPIVMLPGLYDTVQHASVISGYDDAEGVIFHHIPQAGEDGLQVGAIPQEQFERLWSEESHFMILLAPEQVLNTLRLDPGESDRMCLDSERAGALGDSTTASKLLESAIKQDGDNPVAHLLYGSALNESGSDSCVAQYERCIKLNPWCFLAYRGLGNHYLKTGRYDLAEKAYTQAITINPTRYGTIYKNRAISRMKQDRNKEAKSDLELYLERMPQAPDGKAIRDAIEQL